MQTFGPVGEPGDGPQQSAASTTIASGQPVYFNMRDSADVIKVSGSGKNKQITRQSMESTEPGWQTVQVGNELFQAQENTKSCRWVSLSGAARPEKPTITEHLGFAMAKHEGEFIFICGGQGNKFAERFNVQSKIWEAMPELNEPRCYAGACVLNSNLYVFCGMNGEDLYSSIEVMTNACGPQQGMNFWQTINFTEAQLFPRYAPAVAMLNNAEILIMGGNSYVDDDLSSLGDVMIFNVETQQIERKIQNFPGLLSFQAVGNKCMQFEPDTVVALVEDVEQTKAMVVEYKKGTKMVRCLQKL